MSLLRKFREVLDSDNEDATFRRYLDDHYGEDDYPSLIRPPLSLTKERPAK